MQDLSLPQFFATTRQLNLMQTAKVDGGAVTLALTQVHTSAQSLVLNYQTSFDAQKLTAKAQQLYQTAAWISTGWVYRNGQRVGDLNLGIGGQSLAITHDANLTQANFQSTFATSYQDRKGQRHTLKTGDLVKFEYELPGGATGRQQPVTFTVPAAKLLP